MATFESRSVYGNTLNYPVDETAKVLCQLAKAKTLTDPQIVLLRRVMPIHFVMRATKVGGK